MATTADCAAQQAAWGRLDDEPMNTVATPSAPRLSICIPTYNFGKFIGEALTSVLQQMQPGVEIVVLDSGSTDDTARVVRGLGNPHGCLRYIYAPERLGIDRDMARVVQLAAGDYCWLFSADDAMENGALARVMAEIERGEDLYVCMHGNCNIAMQPLDVCHPVLDLDADATFQLAEIGQQLEYFSLAVTTEAFFSFMGGLIVRKSVWESVALNERFVGSCWAHVARLFELIQRGISVRFLAVTLLQKRGDNDSFTTHGVVRRYALAIQGFHELGRHFWGDQSRQTFHIRRVLRHEFPIWTFIRTKELCQKHPATESRRLLDHLVGLIYSDRSEFCVVKRFIYHLLPAPMYYFARDVYRFLRGKPRKKR